MRQHQDDMTDIFRKESQPQLLFSTSLGILGLLVYSKKSPTGPTERTPKPENLIALATSLGIRW